ncbi:unnamed protein product [Linum tenue]|uniref:Uncharacterized protein n=1 Tax=Linum tenue TaxID=586396 RepID=A0AAV0NBG3_9ROSI|nr:unnamed protein product [Linum tenue]
MALVKAAACFLFCLVILHPYVSTVVARTISPATMAPAPSPIIISRHQPCFGSRISPTGTRRIPYHYFCGCACNTSGHFCAG